MKPPTTDCAESRVHLTRLPGLADPVLQFDLPKEIEQLSNLRQLCLYSNKIINIPKEIIQLSNLQKLILFNNEITSIPIEITNFCSMNNINFLT